MKFSFFDCPVCRLRLFYFLFSFFVYKCISRKFYILFFFVQWIVALKFSNARIVAFSFTRCGSKWKSIGLDGFFRLIQWWLAVKNVESVSSEFSTRTHSFTTKILFSLCLMSLIFSSGSLFRVSLVNFQSSIGLLSISSRHCLRYTAFVFVFVYRRYVFFLFRCQWNTNVFLAMFSRIKKYLAEKIK